MTNAASIFNACYWAQQLATIAEGNISAKNNAKVWLYREWFCCFSGYMWTVRTAYTLLHML